VRLAFLTIDADCRALVMPLTLRLFGDLSLAFFGILSVSLLFHDAGS
jgi:hypothetical protein